MIHHGLCLLANLTESTALNIFPLKKTWMAFLSLCSFFYCTTQPTKQPGKPTNQPTDPPISHEAISQPANQPTQPTQPIQQPSNQATKQPSNQATKHPSNQATSQPSQPSQPSNQPTNQPAHQPTATRHPPKTEPPRRTRSDSVPPGSSIRRTGRSLMPGLHAKACDRASPWAEDLVCLAWFRAYLLPVWRTCISWSWFLWEMVRMPKQTMQVDWLQDGVPTHVGFVRFSHPSRKGNCPLWGFVKHISL